MASTIQLIGLRAVFAAGAAASVLAVRASLAPVSPYGCGALFDRYSVPQFAHAVGGGAVYPSPC